MPSPDSLIVPQGFTTDEGGWMIAVFNRAHGTTLHYTLNIYNDDLTTE